MEQVPTERRRRPDGLIMLLRILNAIAVFSLVAALSITAASRPFQQSFFDQFHKLRSYYHWNYPRAAFCLFFGVLSSTVGLVVASRPWRRKKDHIHASLTLCLMIFVIGLIPYFTNVLF